MASVYFGVIFTLFRFLNWLFAAQFSNCSNSLNFEAKINCNTIKTNVPKWRKTCTGLKFDWLNFYGPQSHILLLDHFEGPCIMCIVCPLCCLVSICYDDCVMRTMCRPPEWRILEADGLLSPGPGALINGPWSLLFFCSLLCHTIWGPADCVPRVSVWTIKHSAAGSLSRSPDAFLSPAGAWCQPSAQPHNIIVLECRKWSGSNGNIYISCCDHGHLHYWLFEGRQPHLNCILLFIFSLLMC